MPSNMAGVMRLYTLCRRSRRRTNRSLGSVVCIFPLQAGHRNVFVLSRSCSEIQASMQSSCASRLHGQAFTQTALGVSAGVCKQMKQLRRLGSVCVRCRRGGGVEDADSVVLFGGWLEEARLLTGASFVSTSEEDMAVGVLEQEDKNEYGL